MDYYHAKTVSLPFDDAIARATAVLGERGFGVLTTIDVAKTLHDKIGVSFRPYTILGACNPHFAHRALQAEAMIGTMLPCNVVVQQQHDGAVVVAAVDPVASMAAVDNPDLAVIAADVRALMTEVINEL